MNDNPPAGKTAQPQSVIGPITLSEPAPHPGPITVQPNSVIGPITLGIGTSTVEAIVVSVTCSGGTATVKLNAGAHTKVVTITGIAPDAQPSGSLPAGAIFYGITRTGAELVLMAKHGSQKSFETIAVAPNGTVTITVSNAT